MLLCSTLLMAAPALQAASEWVSGKVDRLLLDENYYGKCMARIGFTASIDCPAAWFSLDCEGNYLAKADAGRMWDSLNLAFVLDKTISVYLDDSRKNNGYCISQRLDVTK
jgi:hypothetical protein